MPELEYEPMEHFEKIDWMVENNGYAVELVAPRDDPVEPRAGYSYTIGLEKTFGMPDLVLFGLAPAAARGLLELVVNRLNEGWQFPVAEPFQGLLDSNLRAVFLDVDVAAHASDFAGAVEYYSGSPFRMLQLVWPDKDDHLPWDDGWPHELRFTQPVIGS